MQCSDCFGDNFVTDYSQGDLICMQCGLVAEQHIFDDRPQFADAEVRLFVVLMSMVKTLRSLILLSCRREPHPWIAASLYLLMG